MNQTAIAPLRNKVKRAYTIHDDQDEAIVRFSAATGESQSLVVRDLLARGIADRVNEEAEKAAKAKR